MRKRPHLASEDRGQEYIIEVGDKRPESLGTATNYFLVASMSCAMYIQIMYQHEKLIETITPTFSI